MRSLHNSSADVSIYESVFIEAYIPRGISRSKVQRGNHVSIVSIAAALVSAAVIASHPALHGLETKLMLVLSPLSLALVTFAVRGARPSWFWLLLSTALLLPSPALDLWVLWGIDGIAGVRPSISIYIALISVVGMLVAIARPTRTTITVWAGAVAAYAVVTSVGYLPAVRTDPWITLLAAGAFCATLAALVVSLVRWRPEAARSGE